MKEDKLSSYGFNEENPFLKQAVEEVQKNIVKKYKTAANTDQKAVLKAFDENTGEILGSTQFIRQIEVDEEKFAKIYLDQFSAFFDLKPPAIKVFGYILNQLIPNKDEFVFLLDECIKYTGYKTKSSIFQGLGQLVQNEIIARGKTDFLYFVNPLVVFNGNRITFAHTYVKKQKNKIPKNQSILDFDNPEEPYKLPDIKPIDAF
ncbi:RepA protein [Chryseobacterium piscium]|uniref:RepA protein n=1 Tax=Chryseobacterium piscium TaxID=333702 RepID=A0A3D9B5I8_9FLAO|nr:replication/maintenance protein RepL [Chryseobacterium piscium]REC48442.1 RepA protein [Chryseobacterium piscium]